jgi:TonB-linked SusC/RagA family outer membrane protein
VIGANVVEKGTANGIVTDVDGNFSLSVSGGAVLQVSYIGYVTQEVTVGNQSTLQIALREDLQALEEVVVVGYGTQKKRDLTGAVASVKVAEMPVQTYSTVSHALAGKAAGMQVTQTSAQVGGGATFRIRGATSTGAGNDPLVIIDGFPVSRTSNEGSGNRYNNGSLDNVLESINPNDIESIEVLKDASATAIYGSRAGHGVIIVTTKRGKNQKLNVTYSGLGSVQHMKNGFRMLNAKEYMTQRNKDQYELYLKNNGLDVYKDYVATNPGHVAPEFVPKYSDAEIASIRGTDWLDEVTRTGLQQSHNISMTGGDEVTRYMASINYFDQAGVLKNNDMSRTTLKFNFDRKISAYVKAGLTFNLSRNQYDNVPLGSGENEYASLIGSAMRFNPTIPVYDENGNYALNSEQSFIPNPVSLLEITDKSVKERVLGSAYVEVEPIKGLTLKASLGVDRRDNKRKTYLPKTTMFGASVNGQASIVERGDMDYLMDLTATYTKEIGQHNFTALAGYSYQEFNGESFSAGNQDFLIDAFLYNNLAVGAYAKPSVGSWAYKSSLGSYFARLNYSFLGKYLLTATVRADGASNFNPEYRWGYFPSASLGWRFSDEAFMQPLASVLSNGKLRIGYGQTGNSNVGNRILDTYGPVAGTVFNESYYIGIRASQLGNPKLTWETTGELNIGLDLGFLNNRINATVEYYDRTISDLLVSSKSLMSYNEITSIASNIGKTQGHGFELTLNTVNITNKDFQWTTDLTYSFYRDRWKERDPNWKPAVYQSADDPIRAWFSYLSDGLLQPGEAAPEHQKSLLPGQIKLKDISGEDGTPDGKLNDYDMVYMGTSDPDFLFGFNNTVKYKSFDLNIYFYGEVNRLRSNSYYEYFGMLGSPSVSAQGFNASKMALETWHHDYQQTKYPNPIVTDFGNGDYYVKNISYVRCRNITLGYVVPLSKKIANRVRVYTDINNPFVLTNWSGVDPETDEHQYAYPNIMSLSLGLDITF